MPAKQTSMQPEVNSEQGVNDNIISCCFCSSLAARSEDTDTLRQHAFDLDLPIRAIHQAIQGGFVHNSIYAPILYCTHEKESISLAVLPFVTATWQHPDTMRATLDG